MVDNDEAAVQGETRLLSGRPNVVSNRSKHSSPGWLAMGLPRPTPQAIRLLRKYGFRLS
jgi:hypothetical protein